MFDSSGVASDAAVFLETSLAAARVVDDAVSANLSRAISGIGQRGGANDGGGDEEEDDFGHNSKFKNVLNLRG